MMQAIVGAVLAAMLAVGARAEPIGFFQVDGVTYDASVPAPEDVFGYEIGERPVRYEDMVAYLTTLADLSDRITAQTIGRSHQGRPILTFTVTSPTNHADIEGVRQRHLARRLGDAPADAAPVVIWMGFGVHGSEPSSMEAAAPFLYHIAAASDEAVGAMLEDTVIIATVALNPDGHARRAMHVDTYWSYATNTDFADEIHERPGRTNHYRFDLNRQWMLATQPEAKAWVSAWQAWKPMVSADYHEMGTSRPYYFHPGERNRKHPLIPDTARDLAFAIAQRHATFFDRETRLFASQEGFDNFYIGKGSTYPQMLGGVGILFEAGSAGGGAIEAERGLVTAADNARTQFNTALTTIEGALAVRDDLIAYQRAFVDAARRDDQAWVFAAPGDPQRAARFVRLLRLHDIAVHPLARDVSAGGTTFAAGEAFVVPGGQPQSTLARGFFEARTEFVEDVFYDVSGWTLPLAYDLDYAPITQRQAEGARSAQLADGTVSPASAPDRAPYGYAFEWSNADAARAANRLFEADVRVRAAREPFTAETTKGRVDFGRGSIFVALDAMDAAEREAVHAVMETIAREDAIPVHAVTSGLTPNYGRDFGGWKSFGIVERPRIVVTFDDGISENDFGEVWWTLDYRHRMGATLVPKSELSSLDWSEYTHLIVPGGSSSMPERVEAEIERWMREGGTLIALQQAAAWAQAAYFRDGDEDEEDDASKEEGETESLRFDYAERELREAEHLVRGAIMAGDVDPSHPIGFGFADRLLPLHRDVTLTLEAPEGDPFAVPVAYADEPLLSGYASPERLGEIAGGPAVVTYTPGAGNAVLIADNPVFRGTYPGTERLLINAVFFADFIQGARGAYDLTLPPE